MMRMNCVHGYSSNKEVVYDAQRAVSGERLEEFEGIVTTVNARTFGRDSTVSPAKNRNYYNLNADT